MRVGLVCVVKDEERLIGEWLAIHALIGVDRFFIYDNCSTDLTAEIASRAARELDVTLVDWPDQTPRFQDRSYQDAVERFGDTVDWLGFIDADEFLLPSGGESISDVLSRLPYAAAVAVNWLIFGSSGLLETPRGLVTENFVYRSENSFPVNRHVKSLIRPSTFTSVVNCHVIGTTSPHVDPLGHPIEWEMTGLTKEVRGLDTLRINHYFVRSRACWDEKMRRGYRDLTRGEDAFIAHDRNDVRDDRAATLGAMARHRFDFLGFRDAKSRQRESVGQRFLRRTGLTASTANSVAATLASYLRSK